MSRNISREEGKEGEGGGRQNPLGRGQFLHAYASTLYTYALAVRDGEKEKTEG